MPTSSEPRIRPSAHVVNGGQDNGQLRLTEVFSVAALRTKGVRFLGTEQAANGRTAFIFDDSDGVARRLLRQHQADGIEVNSLAFAGAISWARDIIFSSRS